MDKEQKSSLTNEELKKAFSDKHRSTSQFDLVNYAIRLAENIIVSSKGQEINPHGENLALQVQDKIKSGKDSLKELTDKDLLHLNGKNKENNYPEDHPKASKPFNEVKTKTKRMASGQ